MGAEVCVCARQGGGIATTRVRGCVCRRAACGCRWGKWTSVCAASRSSQPSGRVAAQLVRGQRSRRASAVPSHVQLGRGVVRSLCGESSRAVERAATSSSSWLRIVPRSPPNSPPTLVTSLSYSTARTLFSSAVSARCSITKTSKIAATWPQLTSSRSVAYSPRPSTSSCCRHPLLLEVWQLMTFCTSFLCARTCRC